MTQRPFDLVPSNNAAADRIHGILKEFASAFDLEFAGFLSPIESAPPELLEAMRYAALGPGKRLRPFLVVRACELLGGRRTDAWPAAAAIECIHAFSLIHDDLPSMDNDDLRRGRPTTHRQFGEAMAILAGDALAVLPFEILARHSTDAAASVLMIRELAAATGWCGMIGGQAADILGEKQPPTIETTHLIHERKTAALFRTACRMGANCARHHNARVSSMGEFGLELGKAFQITDDLLDVLSNATSLGKEVGKDSQAGKQTFPRCVGIEESRAIAQQLVNKAIDHLSGFGSEADDLRALARFVVDRTF